MNYPIQSKLISLLLEPLAVAVSKLSGRARHLIFILGGCIISAQMLLMSAGIWQVRYLYQYTIGCVGLGLMILMLLKPELSPVEFDYKVMIPWFGLGLMVLISGVVQAYDYLPDALLYLFAYPVFFIVAANNSRDQVFSWLHQVADLSFLAFFVISMLFFPMEGEFYAGFFANQNGIPKFLSVCYCFALSSLLSQRGSIFEICKDFIVLGLSAAFIYLTTCRGGIIAILGSTVVAFVLTAVVYRKKIFLLLMKRWIPLVVVIYVAVPSVVFMNDKISYFWVPATPPVTDISSQPSVDVPEQPPVIEEPNFLENIDKRTEQKFNVDRSLNSISSGRWYVWKGYLGELNMTGHSPEYRFKYYVGPEYEHLGENGILEMDVTAHMTILQFAYSNGILAGVCFLLINLIAGIKSVGYLLKHKEERYVFLPLVIAVAYGIQSLLASMNSPFGTLIAFYYFASLIPLVLKK